MPHAIAGDGTRIAYELCGREDGEPLVLIQGLSADRRGWLRQRGTLGERYRLLLIDNRGVGESDRPPAPYDLAEMAGDVLAVMDDAGWDSAHVMGASMGGVIAQILGVLHPERVRSLVLACTACRHETWRRELLAGWKATALEGGMRTFAEANAKWLVGPRSVRRFWPVLNLFGGLALNVAGAAFLWSRRSLSVGAISFAMSYPVGLLSTYTMPRASWHLWRAEHATWTAGNALEPEQAVVTIAGEF